MICTNSKDLFETSTGPYPESSLQARLVCIKDFLKKLSQFPFALCLKAAKTILRFLGIALSALLLGLTFASSRKARELFVERAVCLAKDLADWVLFPFALILCFLRLLLALFIHPSLYSSAP